LRREHGCATVTEVAQGAAEKGRPCLGGGPRPRPRDPKGRAVAAFGTSQPFRSKARRGQLVAPQTEHASKCLQRLAGRGVVVGRHRTVSVGPCPQRPTPGDRNAVWREARSRRYLLITLDQRELTNENGESLPRRPASVVRAKAARVIAALWGLTALVSHWTGRWWSTVRAPATPCACPPGLPRGVGTDHDAPPAAAPA
jgi:hypothetical protein